MSRSSTGLSPLDELALLLRPAGGGLYVVSTGLAAQEALQKRLYNAPTEPVPQGAQPQEVGSADAISRAWRAALGRIAEAKVVVLGVPSDVGAGIRRGANAGPGALRSAWLDARPDLLSDGRVVDVGDVFCIPQLLTDDMLCAEQHRHSAEALYPELSEDLRERLPVAPLTMAERALDLIFAENPKVRVLLLGGDHSVAWPLTAALHRARGRFGIVQLDAHTDLLERRLGVKICFATWSFHANELLGREGRLVQVGIRATRRPKEHWEETLGVKQVWAEQVRQDPEGSLQEILAHIRTCSPEGVYLSNDIDGTDATFADACGTPEPNGISPDFVVSLIRELAIHPGLIAGDLVEVAPDLAPDSAPTLTTAIRYLNATLDGLLR